MKVGDMVRVTRVSLSNHTGDMGIIVKILTGRRSYERPAYKVYFQPCYTRNWSIPYRTLGESHLEKVVG
jgi:hypothetical protein